MDINLITYSHTLCFVNQTHLAKVYNVMNKTILWSSTEQLLTSTEMQTYSIIGESCGFC